MGILEAVSVFAKSVLDFLKKPYLVFGALVGFLASFISSIFKLIFDQFLNFVIDEFPSFADFIDETDFFGWLTNLLQLQLLFDLTFRTVGIVLSVQVMLLLLVPISAVFNKLFR